MRRLWSSAHRTPTADTERPTGKGTSWDGGIDSDFSWTGHGLLSSKVRISRSGRGAKSSVVKSRLSVVGAVLSCTRVDWSGRRVKKRGFFRSWICILAGLVVYYPTAPERNRMPKISHRNGCRRGASSWFGRFALGDKPRVGWLRWWRQPGENRSNTCSKREVPFGAISRAGQYQRVPFFSCFNPGKSAAKFGNETLMNNDLWTEISSNGPWMRFDAISTILR